MRTSSMSSIEETVAASVGSFIDTFVDKECIGSRFRVAGEDPQQLLVPDPVMDLVNAMICAFMVQRIEVVQTFTHLDLHRAAPLVFKFSILVIDLKVLMSHRDALDPVTAIRDRSLPITQQLLPLGSDRIQVGLRFHDLVDDHHFDDFPESFYVEALVGW